MLYQATAKNPKLLSKKSINDITNFDYPSNSRRCTCKKHRGNNILCRLLQGFLLHTQREDRANTTRLWPTQRNIVTIMMLYKNTKVKVRSPDGVTDYFDIVASVLQGDRLAPYIFTICLNYALKNSIV